ncbi:MAG: UDP-N-acetylmuramate--L-alanine ligase [Gammaproteobacteria bacterium]|nr:UDP-N-acetylmuramate--L-alanine ligase [Gammaproteobacteria bacterium]
MRRIKNIHFVGIGGAGMGGIAEVLHNQGYLITGSDLSSNKMVERLTGLGIKVTLGHTAENIKDSDVVVITSALSQNNPELLAAKAAGIPVVRRAEMLAELMRFGQGIAIAGTHGKTTTTSLLASIMATANLDPTFVIGGKLNSLGANAKLGTGSYFIAEADESDASFLHLNPVIAVVTNIDRDHMPTYGGDFQKLRQVFIDFLLRLPFYGMAVINIDDPVARDIIPEICCQVVTYGRSANADYQLLDYEQEECKSRFTVWHRASNTKFELTMDLPGIHNAMNATATAALCLEERIELDYIKQAIANFTGIGRRFQVYKNICLDNSDSKFTMIDDYGHHPNEVLAIITAIRTGWPQKRLVMLYQPHRYTRTRDLFTEFVGVLSQVDVLILLPVYAASELPLAGASSKDLHQAILDNKINNSNKSCYYFDTFNDLFENLAIIIKSDDIVVVQGAGDISQIADKLLTERA